MEDTDIHSEPAYREETVTLLEFSYPSAVYHQTLREGDTIDFESGNPLEIYIHKIARDGYPAEDIVLYMKHLEWTSTRTRVMKWPLKKPIMVSTDQPTKEE